MKKITQTIARARYFIRLAARLSAGGFPTSYEVGLARDYIRQVASFGLIATAADLAAQLAEAA